MTVIRFIYAINIVKVLFCRSNNKIIMHELKKRISLILCYMHIYRYPVYKFKNFTKKLQLTTKHYTHAPISFNVKTCGKSEIKLSLCKRKPKIFMVWLPITITIYTDICFTYKNNNIQSNTKQTYDRHLFVTVYRISYIYSHIKTICTMTYKATL